MSRLMAKKNYWTYLCRVPANEEGQQFVKDFRKYLNTETYSLRTMYSGKRPKGTPQGATRKENAHSIRLYAVGLERNVVEVQFLKRGLEVFRNKSIHDRGIVEHLDKKYADLEQAIQTLNVKLGIYRLLFRESGKYQYLLNALEALPSVQEQEGE